MKTVPASLYTYNQHTLADCYAFEFADGTRRWTTYETTLGSTGHRYWGYLLTSYSGSYVGIHETEMRATVGGADLTGSGTAYASDFYSAGNEAAKAVDNSDATKWYAQWPGTQPKRWWYDFGSPVTIAQFTMRNGADQPTRMPTAWDLQWSDDGVNWTTVASYTATWTTTVETKTFTGDAGVSYSVGPGIVRGDSRTEAGVKADLLSLTVYPDSTTIGGVSMFQAAVAGLFDGVKVTLLRAYMVTPGDVSEGLVTEFAGWISRVEPSSTEIRLTVQSLVSKLSLPLPKRQCAAQCAFRLYDSATCGVNEAANTTTTTTAAGSSATKVRVSTTKAADYYKHGTIAIGGATRGITASRDLGGGVHEVDLASALASAPSSGTSCVLKRGCSKTITDCRDKFLNLVNFGGFPWVPLTKEEIIARNKALGF